MNVFCRTKKYLICVVAIILCVIPCFGIVQNYTAFGSNFVFIGGDIIGFEVNNNGPIVVDIEEISIKNWNISPKLKRGDVILAIDGIEVRDSDGIYEILNDGTDRSSVKLDIIRGKTKLSEEVETYFDNVNNSVKLGIVVKDDICGIGTLTFFEPDGTAYALGHEVIDYETDITVFGTSGLFKDCKIAGINKGSSGSPGTIRGAIGRNKLGMVEKCGAFGLKGTILLQENKRKMFRLGGKNEARPGKAQICSAVSGELEFYDIKIIKANSQNSPAEKSMVIKVVDDRLLSLTGGIVQGMSGSPIIQNGVIIGAVTHVFVNDCKMGYALYADWMI